jgi:hypothetical protein
MDRQLQTKWPKLLNGIARQLNPIHGEIFRKHPSLITGLLTSTSGLSMWFSTMRLTCGTSIPAG